MIGVSFLCLDEIKSRPHHPHFTTSIALAFTSLILFCKTASDIFSGFIFVKDRFIPIAKTAHSNNNIKQAAKLSNLADFGHEKSTHQKQTHTPKTQTIRPPSPLTISQKSTCGCGSYMSVVAQLRGARNTPEFTLFSRFFTTYRRRRQHMSPCINIRQKLPNAR
jgi:hypothetical protein